MNFHQDAGPAGAKVKLRKLAISVGVALTLGVAAVSAQAQSTITNSNGAQTTYAAAPLYNFGTVGNGGVSAVTTLAQPVNEGDVIPFTDSYSFVLGTGTKSSISVFSDFYGPTTSAPYIPNVGMILTLHDSTKNIDIGSSALVPTAAPATYGADGGVTALGSISYGYNFAGLSKNDKYTLTVFGSDTTYLGYTYTLNVAAVPEPESYALLLAGLGMVGAIVRRRKSI